MSENLYAALKTIFHEPNRLAIMSALCAASDGLSFPELKRSCSLTDGNLSRHLRVLESAGAVTIEKGFVGVKPRTHVTLSAFGREQFVAYLNALEDALQRAEAAMRTGRERRTLPSGLGEAMPG